MVGLQNTHLVNAAQQPCTGEMSGEPFRGIANAFITQQVQQRKRRQ